MSKIISSMKALIVDGDKFLIIKAADHKEKVWEIPGGKIEYGEMPIDALKREVREEAGLEIDVRQACGVWWFFSKTKKYQVICNTFLCHPEKDFEIEITNNPAEENILEFRWISKKDLKSKEYVDNMEKSLRDLIINSDF